MWKKEITRGNTEGRQLIQSGSCDIIVYIINAQNTNLKKLAKSKHIVHVLYYTHLRSSSLGLGISMMTLDILYSGSHLHLITVPKLHQSLLTAE